MRIIDLSDFRESAHPWNMFGITESIYDDDGKTVESLEEVHENFMKIHYKRETSIDGKESHEGRKNETPGNGCEPKCDLQSQTGLQSHNTLLSSGTLLKHSGQAIIASLIIIFVKFF